MAEPNFEQNGALPRRSCGGKACPGGGRGTPTSLAFHATRPWRKSSFPRYALPMNDKTQHARDFLSAIAERVGDLVAAPVPAAACAALLNGFKAYLLSEKSGPVAESFLNRYGSLATKGSAQLRRIETNGAFVPGSNPLWNGAVGAALVAARPFILSLSKGRPGGNRRTHPATALLRVICTLLYRFLMRQPDMPSASPRRSTPATANRSWVDGSRARFFKKEKMVL